MSLAGVAWVLEIRVADVHVEHALYPVEANSRTICAKFPSDTISYPLFADADTGIYPHWASQYHARPETKRGIVTLSVDKFPYPRRETRWNELIPCSNDACQILKRFSSFKISDTPFIWLKSSYKHSVARSHCSGKESGRRSWSPLWRNQWRSFLIIFHADDVKREIRIYTSRLLANQKWESAPSVGLLTIHPF